MADEDIRQAKDQIVERLRSQMAAEDGADFYEKKPDINAYGKDDFLKGAPPDTYSKTDEYSKAPN